MAILQQTETKQECVFLQRGNHLFQLLFDLRLHQHQRGRVNSFSCNIYSSNWSPSIMSCPDQGPEPRIHTAQFIKICSLPNCTMQLRLSQKRKSQRRKQSILCSSSTPGRTILASQSQDQIRTQWTESPGRNRSWIDPGVTCSSPKSRSEVKVRRNECHESQSVQVRDRCEVCTRVDSQACFCTLTPTHHTVRQTESAERCYINAVHRCNKWMFHAPLSRLVQWTRGEVLVDRNHDLLPHPRTLWCRKWSESTGKVSSRLGGFPSWLPAPQVLGQNYRWNSTSWPIAITFDDNDVGWNSEILSLIHFIDGMCKWLYHTVLLRSKELSIKGYESETTTQVS